MYSSVLTVDREVGRVLVLGRRVARHARVVAGVPRLQPRERERRREVVDGREGDAEVVVGAEQLPLLLAAHEEPPEPAAEEIMERGD